MYAVFFAALKRIFDLSLVPILLGVLAVMFEWFFNGLTWILIGILDIILRLMTGLLNAVPFPPIVLDDNVFGSMFMDLASILGIWGALAIWLGGAIGALLARLFTLGLVGDQ